MSSNEIVLAVLRRALALSRQAWNGDLYALVGEAVDRVNGAQPDAALAALREIQRTVQPGEPFGDPRGWAKSANAEEVRRALDATIARLLG